MKRTSRWRLALVAVAVAAGAGILVGDIGPMVETRVREKTPEPQRRSVEPPPTTPRQKDPSEISRADALRVSRKGLRQVVSHIPADAVASNMRIDEKFESCGRTYFEWNLSYRVHTRRIELNRPIDWTRMFDGVEEDWAARAGFERSGHLGIDNWSEVTLRGEYEESYRMHLSDDRRALTLTGRSPCFDRR